MVQGNTYQQLNRGRVLSDFKTSLTITNHEFGIRETRLVLPCTMTDRWLNTKYCFAVDDWISFRSHPNILWLVTFVKIGKFWWKHRKTPDCQSRDTLPLQFSRLKPRLLSRSWSVVARLSTIFHVTTVEWCWVRYWSICQCATGIRDMRLQTTQ